MKKLILFLAVLFSLAAHAQSNASQNTLICSANQRVHQSDSVQLWAIFNSGSVTAKALSWSGPTGVTFKDSSSWTNGGTNIYAFFWLSKLTPGIYPFSATGLAASGITTTVYDTLTVIPDPAIPVCPAIPGPPVFTGISASLFGQTIAIPPGQGLKITFTYNGVTQTVTY